MKSKNGPLTHFNLKLTLLLIISVKMSLVRFRISIYICKALLVGNESAFLFWVLYLYFLSDIFFSLDKQDTDL